MVNIEIITGPMFAGKSTMLINSINNYLKEERLLFNYAEDKRYNNEANISSHNKEIIPSIPIRDLFEINKYITNKIKAIYIDETQFMTSIKNWINHVKTNYNNLETIILAGLNFDIYGNNFNQEFIELTYNTNIIKHYLKAKCYICNNNAYYTILLTDKKKHNNENDNITQINNLINNKENKCIGSKELYQPVCLCHALKTNYEHNFKRFIHNYC
jgi:thymidine kinase